MTQFTVFDMEGPEFTRETAEGKIIGIVGTEMEIATGFPLQPKQLICWVDEHRKDNLHFAVVRRATKTGNAYRVRLSFLQ